MFFFLLCAVGSLVRRWVCSHNNAMPEKNETCSLLSKAMAKAVPVNSALQLAVLVFQTMWTVQTSLNLIEQTPLELLSRIATVSSAEILSVCYVKCTCGISVSMIMVNTSILYSYTYIIDTYAQNGGSVNSCTGRWTEKFSCISTTCGKFILSLESATRHVFKGAFSIFILCPWPSVDLYLMSAQNSWLLCSLL